MNPNCFEARQSDDPAKSELELTCIDCGTVLCDVQAGDTLTALFGTADKHVCKGMLFHVEVTFSTRLRGGDEKEAQQFVDNLLQRFWEDDHVGDTSQPAKWHFEIPDGSAKRIDEEEDGWQ